MWFGSVLGPAIYIVGTSDWNPEKSAVIYLFLEVTTEGVGVRRTAGYS